MNATPDSAASVQPEPSSPSAADRMALLHTLAFTALRLHGEAFDAFVDRLAAALRKPIADDAEGDALRGQAAALLQAQRTAFRRLVDDALQQGLLQAVQAIGAQGKSRLASGAMDLSAVGFEAMEQRVLVDNRSQAVDAYFGDRLAALGVRVAQWIGAEGSLAASNPYRSELFLRAVADACAALHPEPLWQRAVVQHFEPGVFAQLGPIYDTLNRELALRNVVPDAELVLRTNRSSPAVPPPTQQDRLQRWLAPTGTLNVISVRAADLLEALLAGMQREEALPPGVRQLLQQLHRPIRKAVQDDPAFFFEAQHPVRRLLAAIAVHGAGCTEEGDGPGYHMLAATIGRLAAPGGMNEASCEQAVDDMASLQHQRLQHALQQQEATVAKALLQEQESKAVRLAAADIGARIENGEVPEFVETFLQQQWVRTLAFGYRLQEAKPDILRQATQLMDDLVWSVLPKTGAEQRKALLARLPGLVAQLNSWLNVIQWSGDERSRFFTELAGHHAAVVRTPAEPDPRERLVERMVAVEKASQHRLARRATEQKKEELETYLQAIAQLVPGNWIEFVRNDASRVRCRLLWISPERTRFLFSGMNGQLDFTLADTALAEAMRLERATIIDNSRVVERVLSAAMQDLGVD